MKKTASIFIAAILSLSVFASCVDVDIPMNDSSVTSTPAEESKEQTENSKEESKAEESAPVSEEPSAPPVYTPIYPEDYEERVAYYSNYTLSADVNDSFFNDSVFVGNSIMLHYKNYVTAKRASNSGLLGNAGFFAASSFSFYNNKHQTASSPDCALPSYQGEKLNITQAIEKMGATTVYLSLMALNDIALYKDGPTGVDETFKLITSLIEELQTAYPDIKIVIMGNTYLHYSSNNMGKLNNGSIHTLNTFVLDYCNKEGIDFVDVAYALIDDKGCLGTEFCSDVGAGVACHLNNTAYNAWTEQLRDYAGKKLAGKWANPTELKGLNKNP